MKSIACLAAFVLAALLNQLSPVSAASFSTNLANDVSRLIEHRLSVKSLDLSRAPSKTELMEAGQLGGLLFATHELKDSVRDRSARLDFGKAIEKWNRHEYPNAVQLFKSHIRQFPDSPWVAEAALHVGCDATYNGRYTEAETLFRQIINNHGDKPDLESKLMVGKARQRLGLLKVEQNNLKEASELFEALLKESPDWRHRTYASHWLQRLSRFTAAKQALLSCGADALAHALEFKGQKTAASFVKTNVPSSMRGHSLADLSRLASKMESELVAIQSSLDEVPSLPLPAILHIPPRSAANLGHFWVLEKVVGDKVELFDPQSEHRFLQTKDELAKEWSGVALVFPQGAQALPGVRLNADSLESLTGGCCGAPRREDDLGNGPNNYGPEGNPCGSPVWSVNVVSMNLHVTDTPLWYGPPIGPPVRIALSYNSQSSIVQHRPFGNKWQFNYASYLVVDTAGTVLIYMPDGRQDTYTPDGVGGYRKPYQIYNALTRIAENHFELRSPEDTVYVYRIPPSTGSLQPFLAEIRDANGNKLTFSYDANARLSTITDAQGKIFTLTYNANNLVTQVADPFGRNAQFRYDSVGNLTNITDMGNYWSSFTYDTNVYLTSIGNERGTTKFRIEPSGASGNSDNYPPPGSQNMWENYRITITNALGQCEEYFYYAGCDQDGFGCSGYTWHVAPRDYVPWQSEQINNYRLRVPKTRYLPTVTASGRRGEIQKILYPEGDFVEYEYDTVTGERTAVKDAHGHTLRYTYNSKGRISSVTDAKTVRTDYFYATNGVDLLVTSNGLGQILMAYDTRHHPTSIVDRLGNTTTFSFNTNGQLTFQMDALGITNEFIYGVDQRLAELRRAGQTIGRYTYDGVGRVRSSTDATGLSITNDYNTLNQLLRATYPDGRFESYVHSTCCPRLLESVTDRGGRTTSFVYDALKRLIQSVNPEGGVTKFGYDTNGNQISLTDPNGNTTTFAYDFNDRLVRKTYADGKGWSFGYDGAGLLTARTNGRGIVSLFAYDSNHQLTNTSHSDGTSGTTNVYDGFGRLVSVNDGIGTSVYSYDANSQLRNADGPWADDNMAYDYDSLGRQTNLLVQGNSPVSYDFDALNRLTKIRTGSDEYVYNYVGVNPLAQRLDRPSGSFTTYQFDGLNRLTLLSNRRTSGEIINQFGYTYNAQDLRASETVSNGLALVFTNQQIKSEFNNLNQLVVNSPSNQVSSYDDDGNLTRGYTPDGRLFSAAYDALNRLKTLTFTNQAGISNFVEYRYGADDFLAERRHYKAGQLDRLSKFLRDSDVMVKEWSNNQPFRNYLWGLGLGGGIGGLLSTEQEGQKHRFTYDGRGNVAAVLSTAEATVAAYAYDPFGQLIAKAGALDQPNRFSTKPAENDIGISDFGYRFNLEGSGRWLSRDPVAEAGGINLYTYALNDPVNLVDPHGDVVPLLLGAWAALEFGLAVYDAYNTFDTLFDPCATPGEKLASGGGFILGAFAPGGGYGTVGKAFTKKSLADQAAELVTLNRGGNRVTLRSPSQKMEVDLAGKSHGGVPTPHTKVSPINPRAPNQPAYNTKNSPVEPATQQDIRTVRRYLERQR